MKKLCNICKESGKTKFTLKPKNDGTLALYAHVRQHPESQDKLNEFYGKENTKKLKTVHFSLD